MSDASEAQTLATPASAATGSTAGDGRTQLFTNRRWRPLLGTMTGVVISFFVIDAALRIVLHPPARPMEVADAVRNYQRADPSILVLGSSHVRTFDSVAVRLPGDSGGTSLLSVPLEAGKFMGYWWVLKNRLAPLIDERNASDALVRSSLRQVVVVTSWFDSCRDAGDTLNIPARAWTFHDFRNDLLSHGITSYNRAFISARWAEIFSASSLVRNRVGAWIPGAVRERLMTPAQRAPHDEIQTALWQEMVEAGHNCMGHPDQMVALDSVLMFFRSRHLPVTLILYPLKPGTLTSKARATTLTDFAFLINERVAQYGVPVFDLTTSSPLKDEDFSPDYDHLRPEGNGRLASWALQGPLAFLMVRNVPTHGNSRQ